LHHKGGKTGTDRVNPLVYQQVGDAWAIFASKGGDPKDPHWFLNLLANPETKIEVGTETVPVRARVAEGDERTQIWEAQKLAFPQFAQYEADAEREIPVVVLDRR
jgi:deazaflavin-dependent oxidoreductase (nitroreductase family)